MDHHGVLSHLGFAKEIIHRTKFHRSRKKVFFNRRSTVLNVCLLHTVHSKRLQPNLLEFV